MRINTSARFATACLLAGALACASNSARVDDETAAAPGDTTTGDTTMTEAAPGYSGMESDTSMTPDSLGTQTPDSLGTPVDTFLQEQGTGVPTDTQGYGGFEQPDTSGTAEQTGYDTTGTTGYDTTGQTGYDTTGYGQQQPGADTTGMAQDSSQWQQDSIAP